MINNFNEEVEHPKVLCELFSDCFNCDSLAEPYALNLPHPRGVDTILLRPVTEYEAFYIIVDISKKA